MDAHCLTMQQALARAAQVIEDAGIERRGSNLRREGEAVLRFRDRETGQVYTVSVSPNPMFCK